MDSRNFDSCIAELTASLSSVQEWMNGVRLKLNPDKTEFIIIGDRCTRDSLTPKLPGAEEVKLWVPF